MAATGRAITRIRDRKRKKATGAPPRGNDVANAIGGDRRMAGGDHRCGACAVARGAFRRQADARRREHVRVRPPARGAARLSRAARGRAVSLSDSAATRARRRSAIAGTRWRAAEVGRYDEWLLRDRAHRDRRAGRRGLLAGSVDRIGQTRGPLRAHRRRAASGDGPRQPACRGGEDLRRRRSAAAQEHGGRAGRGHRKVSRGCRDLSAAGSPL